MSKKKIGYKEDLHFRVHVPLLLAEITNHGLAGQSGVLKIPMNVFRMYLGQVAQRAIELDDPKLNILMLEMALYEVEPKKILSVIEKEKQRIVNHEKNPS